MANLRRRSSFAGRGRRRQTLWIGSADSTGVVAIAAGGVRLDGSLNAAALALRPFTIVRTRGWVFVKSDQEANTEVPFGAMGMSVVSDTAILIGITAIPTPITDESSDLFFMWQSFIADRSIISAIGFDDGGSVFHFDSKAMRKVEEGSDLAITLENASSTAGLSFITKFRILIKLH